MGDTLYRRGGRHSGRHSVGLAVEDGVLERADGPSNVRNVVVSGQAISNAVSELPASCRAGGRRASKCPSALTDSGHRPHPHQGI